MKLTRNVFCALIVLFFMIINLSSCGFRKMTKKSSNSTGVVLGEMEFDFEEKNNNKRKLKKEKKQ
jgi:hypothetical protein